MHDHPRANLHFIWVGPLGRRDPWKDPTPTKARASAFTTCFGSTRLSQRLMAIESSAASANVSGQLQLRDNATMEGPGPADGTTLPASAGTT